MAESQHGVGEAVPAGHATDGSTPPPDRTLALARLTDALTRAERSTAVLLVDLDHFRMINASRGHDVGDRLLAAVGARLGGAVSGQLAVASLNKDRS